MNPSECRERDKVLRSPTSMAINARIKKVGFAIGYWFSTNTARAFVHPNTALEVLKHRPELKTYVERTGPRIQIKVVRDADLDDATELARELYDLFHGLEESSSATGR